MLMFAHVLLFTSPVCSCPLYSLLIACIFWFPLQQNNEYTNPTIVCENTIQQLC